MNVSKQRSNRPSFSRRVSSRVVKLSVVFAGLAVVTCVAPYAHLMIPIPEAHATE